MVKKTKIVALISFILAFLVYYFSSGGLTVFNHFALLADAFLKAHLYVSLQAPWLEQVPIDSSHFYVPYPPMPGVLLMPFRLVFKSNFAQDYLGYILAASTVVIMISISQTIKKDVKLAVWTGLLSAFGTISWFLASVGSSWYLSQICASFFLTAGLLELMTKKRYFLVGLLFGAAYLSRIEVALAFPLIFFLAYDKKHWLKNFIKMAAGTLPFILFNFYYNFSRFGVIWDKAYELIPGVSKESWFNKGVENLSYIPRHLKIIFTELPAFKNKFPFFFPGSGGLAIWFTTPAFVYALGANIKERVVRFSWISILLISLIIFSHGSTGFAEFGYRFAVDFYPILIFLVIKGVARTGVKWHHWVLLAVSIIVNLWGVILINKLGFVS